MLKLRSVLNAVFDNNHCSIIYRARFVPIGALFNAKQKKNHKNIFHYLYKKQQQNNTKKFTSFLYMYITYMNF